MCCRSLAFADAGMAKPATDKLAKYIDNPTERAYAACGDSTISFGTEFQQLLIGAILPEPHKRFQIPTTDAPTNTPASSARQACAQHQRLLTIKIAWHAASKSVPTGTVCRYLFDPAVKALWAERDAKGTWDIGKGVHITPAIEAEVLAYPHKIEIPMLPGAEATHEREAAQHRLRANHIPFRDVVLLNTRVSQVPRFFLFFADAPSRENAETMP